MTFHDIIVKRLRALPMAAHASPVEPLAHLDYLDELALKNQALLEFWRIHQLPLTPPDITPAPRPRHYRTTTRRHAAVTKGVLQLTVAPVADSPAGIPGTTPDTERSELEPPEHAALYAFLRDKLNEPHFRSLAGALNHLIVRGSYVERAVIFNVFRLDGTIVRKLKILAPQLSAFDRDIVSAFVFFDPERSRYYLDSAPPAAGSFKTKKLFGPEMLLVNLGSCRYRFFPTVFSQVNEAMVPVMLDTARELLAPAANQHLIDLYCGYGLFTHFLAGGYAHACGLELSRESIEAAELNTRLFPATNRVAFRVAQIGGGALLNQLPRPDQHAEVVLTDPPRQGMPEPVIAALASRRPVKVLQACCGTDEIPRQLAAWHSSGYRLTAIRPLDMFAGTPHLETLLLLEPGK